VPGLVCNILGLLVLPVFWSGLPIVLGTAGALLGREARTTGRGLALVAVIVGIAAVVLDLLALLAGRLLSYYGEFSKLLAGPQKATALLH
jgi:hypothetical protein